MAEVIVPTPRQRYIADMRAAGLSDDAIISRLSPKGETIIIQQAAPKRSAIPWVVVGSLIALSMMLSFFWNISSRMLTTIEQMAEQNVQAAATVSSAPSGAPVWVLVGIALVFILLGIMRR